MYIDANNKVLLHSMGNYILYPVTDHNGKEYDKGLYTYKYIYMCVCIYLPIYI